MSARAYTGLLLASLAVAAADPAAGAGVEPTPQQVERARDLARRLIVVDTHIDVPYRLEEGWEDVTRPTEGGHFDFERARRGGLDAAWMSIYVPASHQTTGGAKALADRLIDRVEALVGRAPDRAVIATSPAAVEAAARAGKLALPMGIENGAAIESDLANLAHFHRRGVRYITLTHGKNNLICDSSYEKPDHRRWHGLSPFGRQVIAEMNRLGILVDLSHVSDEAFDQALAASAAPPIASHSSLRHFTPGFERNVDDARLAALAAQGGVVQIAFGSAFVTAAANRAVLEEFAAGERFQEEQGLDEEDARVAAFRKEHRKSHPIPLATIDDVADHVDHAVRVAGIDHVGIGSDFDGIDALPPGLESVADYPNLIAELLARGFTEAQLERFLGGNLLRVWREAEQVARRLAATPAR
jgi:membrane dipeptidase